MDTTDIERKRSYSDVQALEDFNKIDQARYCKAVFDSDDDQIEDTIEAELIEGARQYDLVIPERDNTKSAPPGTPNDPTPSNTTTAATTTSSSTRNSVSGNDVSVHNLAVSLSGTTMSSFGENMKPDSLGSIASISTRPTSYSSNEGRIAVALDQPPKQPNHSRSSSLMQFTYNDKRLMQGLKHAFGKFPALRKRKNGLVVAATTQASLEVENEKKSEVDNKPEEHKPLTPTPTQNEEPTAEPSVAEMAAILRSQENDELIKMQSSQTEVRDRHLLFEKEVFDALQEHHRRVQEERRLQHVQAEKENYEQNNADAAKLEERHLVAELTLLEDFEREKQSCHTRIRHMEAYCTNMPTPPATPQSDGSQSSEFLPVRRITKKQKDRLSQGYYERESMDSLHESRIKVLRDKQERQHQNALRRMERELDQLVKSNEQDRQALEKQCQTQHQETVTALEAKRDRLKWRWSVEQMIARKKLELKMGDTYGPLPEISFPKLEEFRPGMNDFSEIALMSSST